jgi:serine phosphatase RsbU (regulator of sigma subunit)
VLVRGQQATALRSPAGILLGAARSGYDAASLELRRGDLLLLYSDGLIERRHRSLDDGLSALTAAAAGITDPENMISAVLDTLGSTDTEDDTCLVALYVY